MRHLQRDEVRFLKTNFTHEGLNALEECVIVVVEDNQVPAILLLSWFWSVILSSWSENFNTTTDKLLLMT